MKKILKGSPDSFQSSSPSVKIQIKGVQVWYGREPILVKKKDPSGVKKNFFKFFFSDVPKILVRSQTNWSEKERPSWCEKKISKKKNSFIFFF